MKKFKVAYTYLFYVLYKFFGNVKHPFLTDFKAVLGLGALEIWLILSGFVYLTVITKSRALPSNPINGYTITFLVFFALVKFYFFWWKDKWKGYVQQFDAWPKEKKSKWTLITWGVIILIIANLVFSFYLMSLIDWRKYNPNYVS